MKFVSYWHDTAPAFAGALAAPPGGRVDVAIIGGGFTGLSAALALAKRGASVAVIEAEQVIGAGSGRNGGHCNNGFSPSFSVVAGRYGVERAAALYHAFDAAVDTVERLVAEEGIDCHFRRCGKLKLAVKPEHYDAMGRSFEQLQRHADPEAVMIPPGELGAEVRSASFHGGMVMPKSAQMHMGEFGHGLAEAAARRGVQIFEQTRMTRLRRLGGSRHRVETSRGALEADQVLLAAGASMQSPLFFRRRVIPIGTFIVATEPLSDEQIEGFLPGRRNVVTSAAVGNYFRITPDNRLLFGGRTRFALPGPGSDAKSGRMLEARLRSFFPQLAKVGIDYCWGGIVDVNRDRLPRAGEQDGLFYALGYSGHGVQMSVEMGWRMAAIMGGEPVANPFEGLPWPPVPGHFGPPWFLPLVGLYYRLKDGMK